jgi:quercetin dioxygenase-like cupin family protein
MVDRRTAKQGMSRGGNRVSENTGIFFRGDNTSWQTPASGIQRKILAYHARAMLVRVAFDANAVGVPHSHPHVQCTLVESGVFDVTIAGRTERLRAGDSFTVPPNAEHGVVAIEAGMLLDAFAPARLDFLAER